MANLNYDEGVPSVAPETSAPDDTRRINANPDQFGGLIAKGVEKAGQGVEQASTNIFDISQFRGKINSDDQTNHYITTNNNILYGDPSKSTVGPDGKSVPDLGYMGLQGRAASDQRAGVLKQLEDARQEGRKNLASPQEQLEYDAQTKRLYSDAVARTGSHADGQWKSWAGDVNGKGAEHSMTGFLNNLDNPVEMSHNARDYISFKVQQSQIRYGDDPQINAQVEEDAKRDLLKAQVQFVSVKDPAGAQRILEKNKNIAGQEYETLANQLRTRADQQTGRTAGTAFMARASQNMTAQFAAGQPPTEGAKALLRNFEGFKPQAYWDVNHWRVGYGSDTVTKADGSVVPVTPGMEITQADAERDLARRTDVTQKNIQGQIGSDAWNALPPAAQGVLSSVSYNYGTLPAQVVRAAQTGDTGAMAQAISALASDNGGVNANRRNTEAAILSGRSAPSIKADALRLALNDNSLSDEQRTYALHEITQTMNAQEIADNQTARAQKLQVDTAAGGYTTKMWDMVHSPHPDYVSLAGAINHDPAFDSDWKTKDALIERIKKLSGEEQSLSFGPGYREAREGLLSPPGTPGHIDGFASLVGRDDITTAGLSDLKGRMSLVKASVDRHAIEQRITSFLTGAKKDLSFAEDNGFFKLRDPKGEKIFSYQFEPEFVKRASALADEAEKTGIHDKLDKFLSKENVQKMVNSYRDPRQMAVDKMQATGEATGADQPNAPLPLAPEGVDQKIWSGLVSAPPVTPDGRTPTHDQYAHAMQILLSNPTPEVMAKFDRWGGGEGHNAKDILAKFNPQAAGKTNEAVPAMAATTPAAVPETAPAPVTTHAGPAAENKQESQAIAAPVAEVEKRHAYITEGLSAIAEGRAPSAKVGMDEPYKPLMENVPTPKIGVSEMAGAQLGEGMQIPALPGKTQQYWDDRERGVMQQQIDQLDKRAKSIDHLARDSDTYKIQKATIDRQRAWMEQQKQEFEDSVNEREKAKT